MDEVVKIREQKVWKIKDSRVIPLPTWWIRDKVKNNNVSIGLTKDGNLLIRPVDEEPQDINVDFVNKMLTKTMLHCSKDVNKISERVPPPNHFKLLNKLIICFRNYLLTLFNLIKFRSLISS